MGERFNLEGRLVSLYYRVCARMPTNVTNRAAKEALVELQVIKLTNLLCNRIQKLGLKGWCWARTRTVWI